MGESGGFFRGTSQEQDSRFSDKEKKLIKTMKFPPEFNIKVDMKKIKLEVIKPWIGQKITQLLGFEDEVVIGYVFSLLEEKQNPDPKLLQINITGFLATDASEFVLELWKILMGAQNNIGGIPPQFLEKKKEEIRARKVEADRIKEELKKRDKDGINSLAAPGISQNGASLQQTNRSTTSENKTRDSGRERKEERSKDDFKERDYRREKDERPRDSHKEKDRHHRSREEKKEDNHKSDTEGREKRKRRHDKEDVYSEHKTKNRKDEEMDSDENRLLEKELREKALLSRKQKDE